MYPHSIVYLATTFRADGCSERRAVACKSIRGLTPVGILVRKPARTDISGVLYPDVVMFVLCLATRMRGPDQQEIGREG